MLVVFVMCCYLLIVGLYFLIVVDDQATEDELPQIQKECPKGQ